MMALMLSGLKTGIWLFWVMVGMGAAVVVLVMVLALFGAMFNKK